MVSLATIIDDEILIIENGGEMPEVIFHGCLYFLGEDLEGPQITISAQDMLRLKLAVVEGYRKIILRDLTLENRDKGLYRGLARSIVNVQRLRRFCQREALDSTYIEAEVRERLREFVEVEYAEVCSRQRKTCVNCSQAELRQFFSEIGLHPSQLPEGWQGIFCSE